MGTNYSISGRKIPRSHIECSTRQITGMHLSTPCAARELPPPAQVHGAPHDGVVGFELHGGRRLAAPVGVVCDPVLAGALLEAEAPHDSGQLVLGEVFPLRVDERVEVGVFRTLLQDIITLRYKNSGALHV